MGIGRDAFEKRTWEWKAEYGGRIAGQIRRLGASCDWSRERFTLDDGLSDAVLEAFVSLHDRGLIYKGTYMVNWAPKLQTAVSDLEVERRRSSRSSRSSRCASRARRSPARWRSASRSARARAGANGASSRASCDS